MSIFDDLRSGVSTRSQEEMMTLGRRLAGVLPEDTVIALHGDLGAGKTVFVKGLADGLGVSAKVTSPTYTIFSIYEGNDRRLVHLDAYRLDDPAALDALMLDDFLISPFCLAVEWPDKIAAWLPEERTELFFEIEQNGVHRVRGSFI